MKKGQALNNQRFERYFMAKIETVDAIVVGVVDEYHLIVKVGDELHRVNFALDGMMRSKERLEAHKECSTQKRNVPGEVRALCKRLGMSVRLHQAMKFWVLRQRLWCRMREGIWRCEAGLCDRF